ncbi:hypothetical protein GGR58DRAFT_522172 [Xylaria digitata]|nr:hypothetical protein GGR58DRAFT_522172 [Xylaria digitata]
MPAAAKFGSIVVINVSPYRCDATIIKHGGQSVCLRTKPITAKLLERLRDVLAVRILEALGFNGPPDGDNFQRIWWIPTGLLIRLPLHTAGYHRRQSGETVIDRVMSSYSSSVKTIIRGRGDLTQQATYSKTLEHRRIVPAGMCQSNGLETIEPPPLKQEVPSQLPDCTIFHLAGHGITDNTNLLESYLLLEDWDTDRLTVEALLDMNPHEKPPFLACLAYRLAGFRHALETLWSVNDESCLEMAKIIYEEIMTKDMSDDSMCKGLHKATRSLRDRGGFEAGGSRENYGCC